MKCGKDNKRPKEKLQDEAQLSLAGDMYGDNSTKLLSFKFLLKYCA